MVHSVCEIIASSRAPPCHPLSLFPPVIGVTPPLSSSSPCHCCHSFLLSLVLLPLVIILSLSPVVTLPSCHWCHSPLVIILSLSLLSLLPPVIGVTPLLSSSCPCHCCHPPCLHLSVPSIPWGPSFLVKRSSFMWTRGLGTI